MSRGAPARPRLVVLSKAQHSNSSTDLVDLAHETLIRYNRDKQPYWATLRTEITKRRKEIENRQLAEALAKEWRENGSSRWSGLATRAQRKAFRRLRDLSVDATAYVKASRFAGWLLNGFFGFMIFLILGTTWLWQKGYSVDHGVLKVRSLFMSIHVEPKMETVPAGIFRQGDIHRRGGPEEQPVHEVRIKPFAIGEFEVTFDEYDRYAIATSQPSLPGDQGWGRGRRPVINVSWEDARDYATWLSKKTGKRYRLPTEAEWEYAARSGGQDEIWAGTSEEKQVPDYAAFVGNSQDRTSPVGGKKPNGIGLHDMSGNVWEWLEDCLHENYGGAPTDGSAWLEADRGNCKERVMRGGSWDNSPWYLRSSYRHRWVAIFRHYSIGFRLARDID